MANYFEGCGWTVESVSVCREVEALRKVLERRTNALLQLETAWADWVGNPANVKGYDAGIYSGGSKAGMSMPESSGRSQSPETLIQGLEEDNEATPSRTPSNGSMAMALGNAFADPETVTESHHHIHTTRPRPTMRPHWFGNKVDAIEFWEKEYRAADEQVRSMRKKGQFEATHAAFVTFEDVKDAVSPTHAHGHGDAARLTRKIKQTACQVVHYPHHSEVLTEPAPEPRDVVWSKICMSQRERQVRDVIIMGVMTVLLLFWIRTYKTLRMGLLAERCFSPSIQFCLPSILPGS